MLDCTFKRYTIHMYCSHTTQPIPFPMKELIDDWSSIIMKLIKHVSLWYS